MPSCPGGASGPEAWCTAPGRRSATEAGADETALLQLADQSCWAPAIEGLDTLVFLAPPFAAEEERFAANALVASPGGRTTCANRP
ncbi:MAG TPA: hypothetical protein VH008_22840 [Pseudonocardia sp.]|nr:hypothetical protein [Pseudonocardia sp.]